VASQNIVKKMPLFNHNYLLMPCVITLSINHIKYREIIRCSKNN
jgi:hypothetical protein